MSKSKIFNDPVYGFVTVPYGILFDLVEHPYFQRLRRISQVGLTYYVYPGALHTRFQHAIGALHLMREAVEVLKSKDVEITDQECEAVSIAILLHDIGHGPFSHALEHTIVNMHHEDLSIVFMNELNLQFDGKLTMAIDIFKDRYSKKFLHQLVSGQLDMDRMDYLNRDSFFTGVSEGVIGYDRIIKMLNVKNDSLVVEEKGVYSIEKFLIARRLMYWQVYLHKTAYAAEQMLIQTLRRAKLVVNQGERFLMSEHLNFLLTHQVRTKTKTGQQLLLSHFAKLDDVDILFAIKQFTRHSDRILAFLAKGLIERKLFRVELKNKPFSSDYLESIRQRVVQEFNLEKKEDLNYLVFDGEATNHAYNALKDEIKILFKDGNVKPLSALPDYGVSSKIIKKYFLCYPKYLP